jgi:hypothetical protein
MSCRAHAPRPVQGLARRLDHQIYRDTRRSSEASARKLTNISMCPSFSIAIFGSALPALSNVEWAPSRAPFVAPPNGSSDILNVPASSRLAHLFQLEWSGRFYVIPRFSLRVRASIQTPASTERTPVPVRTVRFRAKVGMSV